MDGTVEGDIRCKGKIVVGPKGCVTGNITAENAEILGQITGNVQVDNKLVLKATATIKGDIASRQLEIEPNAQLNGTCRMENPVKA